MAIPEYESRKYEDLSNEFKEKAGRTCELIKLMYNRLTLVDKLSYKQAIRKICDDHVDIPGFSFRNIRRNLPSENPSVPRRVTARWPNSSPTHNVIAEKLSSAELQDETIRHQSKDREDSIQFIDYREVYTHNTESNRCIPRHTTVVTTDKIRSIAIRFKISRGKYEDVKATMNSSSKYCYLLFDASTGLFLGSESDQLSPKMNLPSSEKCASSNEQKCNGL
ncbi:MAG TPA: hypothetical protein VH500_18500 [Nitrososphaeraceae archaeon]